MVSHTDLYLVSHNYEPSNFLHITLLIYVFSRLQFLPARRYASAVFAIATRPSVCLSHAGIVPGRVKAGS